MNFSQKWKASFYCQAQLCLPKSPSLLYSTLAATFRALPFVDTLSARQWYQPWSDAPSHTAVRGRACTENDSNCQSSSYARRWSGTYTSQQDEVGLQRSTEAKLQTQWQSWGLLGKIHRQTGKSCLQGSGKGKPFKAEAWGDTDSKKQSWINTDRALNKQAHLYLGRQGKVTRQSL